MAGIEKLLALGSYPDTSLQKARAKRDAARAILEDGRDPGAERRAEKSVRAAAFFATPSPREEQGTISAPT
jgi:Arm DNA-binding domain